jgi:hypothetical protein
MAANSLFKNTFNRSIEEPDTVALLQQITKEHPYFSLAHFFLLKQTDSKQQDYPAIAATTALHLQHPFLLHAQLHKNDANEALVMPPIITAPSFATDSNLEHLDASNGAPVIASDEEMSPALAEQSTMSATPALQIPQPTVETGEHLLFEPLHTTDYFASQGIKLSQDVMPTDKLGKQLKSFTEWLKTMKKVHDATPLVNDQVDSSVQHLAENSNKDAEVLTETMAEVFLQQGKRNKAKEIYSKLSLLNPDKSAYFAAKLENLK